MDFLMSIIRIAAWALFLALFVPYCFFLLTLYRALSKCSKSSRTMEPGLVWLMFVPLVNFILQFFVVAGLARSLGNEFRSRGISSLEPEPGKSIGIALGICSLFALVPILNFVAFPVCVVLFFIYWSKIAGFSKGLDRVAVRGGAAHFKQPDSTAAISAATLVPSIDPPFPVSVVALEVGRPAPDISLPLSVASSDQLSMPSASAASSRKRSGTRKALLFVTAGFVAVTALAVVYWVSQSKTRACDTLAASPYDQNRPWGIKGVPFAKLDANRAVAACQVAVESKPIPRLYAELGRAMTAAGNPDGAVTNLRIAADRGYALAQNDLGAAYASGRGVTQSNDEAEKWFKLSAAQGNAVGQTNLGDLYSDGIGVAKSLEQAATLYRSAAEKGFDGAEDRLGDLYVTGVGVPRSFPDAAKWYRLAADKGNQWAEYSLGALYQNGTGVPRSYADAAKWYRLSADQGNADAQLNLGVLYEHGAGVPASSAEAVKYYKLAAAQGSQQAALNLKNVRQDSNNVAIAAAVIIGALALDALLGGDSHGGSSGGSSRQASCNYDDEGNCHHSYNEAEDANKDIQQRSDDLNSGTMNSPE